MNAPTFSAIIPNYNHAHYLPRSLGAFLAQKRKFDEIIVVDDASTDNSVSLVRAIAADNPSIKLIRHGTNRGVNAALNTGISASTGDYVLLGAADDCVRNNLLWEEAQLAEDFPNVGVVSGMTSYKCLDTGLEWTLGTRMPKYYTKLSPSECHTLAKKNTLFVSSPCALFKKSCLDEVGNMRPEFRWNADWFVAIAIPFRHGMAWCPKVLADAYPASTGYYGSHADNMDLRADVIECILLELEKPEYADVRPAFQKSGFVGQLSSPVLSVVLSSKAHLGFVRPSLFRHAFTRLVERLGRKHIPPALGQKLINHFYHAKMAA